MNTFTHVIIFHDKSKKFINQQTYDAIWNLSSTGNEKLRIGDSIVAFSSIAKIINKDEFYQQYPKELPQQTSEYKDLKALGYEGIIKISGNKGIKEMIKGLNGYISSERYQGTENTLELLKLMESKI